MALILAGLLGSLSVGAVTFFSSSDATGDPSHADLLARVRARRESNHCFPASVPSIRPRRSLAMSTSGRMNPLLQDGIWIDATGSGHATRMSTRV
jgi:hypothetical protein